MRSSSSGSTRLHRCHPGPSFRAARRREPADKEGLADRTRRPERRGDGVQSDVSQPGTHQPGTHLAPRAASCYGHGGCAPLRTPGLRRLPGVPGRPSCLADVNPESGHSRYALSPVPARASPAGEVLRECAGSLKEASPVMPSHADDLGGKQALHRLRSHPGNLSVPCNRRRL